MPVTAQSGWRVSWPSADYVTYDLQRASTLDSTNTWTDLGSNYIGNGGIISVFDPVDATQAGFYRVYAQP